MGGADVRGDACGGKNVVHGGVPCAIPPAGRSRWDGQSRKRGIEGLPHPSVSEGEPRFFEWCGRRPKADNTVVKSRVAAVPHGRSVHPVKRVAPWWSLDRSRLDKVSARLRAVTGRMPLVRSEEHTSELQSLKRISYAVFRLK